MGKRRTDPRKARARLGRAAALVERGLLDPGDAPFIEEISRRYALSISEHLADLIRPGEPEDPIARQFLPTRHELEGHAADLSDPVGDRAHTPVKGVVHRYPDRLLLKVVDVCPAYCRFCFRRESVGHAGSGLTPGELDAALAYVRRTKEIWEVILSGGDPLMLSNRRLKSLMARLNAIAHVRVLRIHTRFPIVSPGRIDDALLDALRGRATVYVVIHCNHPDELTAQTVAACARLVDAGIPLLSQTVLLKGVNDDAETMSRLMRRLVEVRIKPYYLHHPDRAPGTAHFRCSLAQGRELARSLRGRLSGLCQPTYVLDIPGGYGKSPIGPEYLRRKVSGWEVVDYRGEVHDYHDPAGECIPDQS